MPLPEEKDEKNNIPGQNNVDPDNNAGDNEPKGDDPGDQNQNPESDGDMDLSKLDEGTQAYIKKLRQENAKYRTGKKDSESELSTLKERFSNLEGGLKKALGIEDDDQVDPETQIQALQAQSENLQFELSVRDIALENGLGTKDQVDYLGFLIQKEAQNLDDNEELSEEKMVELIGRVKSSMGAGSPQSKTSVTGNNGQGGENPPAGTDENVTVERFTQMTLSEKSELFSKNRPLYDSLMAQARSKRLI